MKCLKTYREDRGYTKVEFSELTGINRNRISWIESGRKEPTLKELNQYLFYTDLPFKILTQALEEYFNLKRTNT